MSATQTVERCRRCGARRESTIHDTDSSNVEIRMASHEFLPPGGAEFIVAERRKQMEENGYDAAHDDAHSDGELLRQAMDVVLAASEGEAGGYTDSWGIVEKWGYGNPVKLLTIAGALIAAEIDRLKRLEARS